MRRPDSPWHKLNEQLSTQLRDASFGWSAQPVTHMTDLTGPLLDTLQTEITTLETWLHARAVKRASMTSPSRLPTVHELQERERALHVAENLAKQLNGLFQRYDLGGDPAVHVHGVLERIQMWTQSLGQVRRYLRRPAGNGGGSAELARWVEENDPGFTRLDNRVTKEIRSKRRTLALVRLIHEQYAKNPRLTVDQLVLPEPESTPESESPQFLGRVGGAGARYRAYRDITNLVSNDDAYVRVAQPGGEATGYTGLTFTNVPVSDTASYVLNYPTGTAGTADSEAPVQWATGEAGGDSPADLATDEPARPGVSPGVGGGGGQLHRWSLELEGVGPSAGEAALALDPADASLRAADSPEQPLAQRVLALSAAIAGRNRAAR